MSERFAGLRNAQVFEKGVYLQPGQYRLKINRCILRPTEKSGDCFFAEVTVLETSDPQAHPVGSKASWCQKCTNKLVAFPSLKVFIYSVLGKTYAKDKEYLAEKVDPVLDKILDGACARNELMPEGQNAFAGREVCVRTYLREKDGKKFTNHDWYPAPEKAAAA